MKRIIVFLIVIGSLVWNSGAAMASPPAQTDQSQEYIVQPGDCLAKIAERVYGKQRFWPAIMQATNLRAIIDSRLMVISNANLIHSGQILWLPSMSEVRLLLAEADPEPAMPVDGTIGLLAVDMEYIGNFYREVFDYSKEAPNIRHFAVVMTEAEYEAEHTTPGRICSIIDFPKDDGILQIRSDLGGVEGGLSSPHPFLASLHPLPYEAELTPGRYYVGGCFIAAPLSREEAEVGDDVILYAGITGGGASSEFQIVTIEPGKRQDVTIILTDRNGWACPWVYAFNGDTFERRSEIMRNLNAKTLETTERTSLGTISVQDGTIRLQIREEKPETTYLDTFYLEVGGMTIRPQLNLPQAGMLADVDQYYLILQQGDICELTFDVSSIIPGSGDIEVTIISAGYYKSENSAGIFEWSGVR